MKAIQKSFSPAFRELIQESARKCFGILGPGTGFGFKYLRRNPVGPLASNHYLPDLAERDFRDLSPDFETDLQERRIQRLNKLKRRGKGPPKKGEGKRAGRKK